MIDRGTLQPGDVSPVFALYDQRGDRIQLDHAPGWRLVWWIPSTMAEVAPPCSDQIAKGFTNHDDDRLTVFGMSFDTPDLLKTFARRAGVSFSILADESMETGKVYGVYRGDEDEWNCFPRKRAFLVAPDGRIAKVYFDIDPDLFVHEVLDDLNELAPRKTSIFGRVLSSLKG